ncbi:hypothetical protein CRG98_011511 [Punica granatum]|uniref:Peptidase A1 domain-containing protein n=1 Tax=Punica granatum TaxID=22663 RepID=A0A2I0KHC3_PUNGR|nr:hypothetical protein CRG98_011511 [Punica granatum]
MGQCMGTTDLDPSLFRFRRDGGGFILDTGTAPTLLLGPAYDEVKAALVRILRWYMKPGHPVKPYDLCYPWPLPWIPHLPSLTFHLQHADLEIDFWNVFQTIDVSRGRKVVCLAMHRVSNTQQPSILGAIQQANYRFVHDLTDQSLIFYPEKCTGN